MKSSWWRVVVGGLVWLGGTLSGWAAGEIWLTTPDRAMLFAKQSAPLTFGTAPPSRPEAAVISVDDGQVYQEVEGFGYTLTGGSAMHLVRMEAGARAALLQELFATHGTNIGVSYLRLSVGASDLNARVFSYHDLAPGESDPELKRFDLGPDRADVVPVLKEILAINPALGLMASPWSAPTWMKTTNDTRGGSLRVECHDVYARYLVKYVQAMAAEGIRVGALTIQNEPLHPGNNPSMYMPASQQAAFIEHSLGPALAAAGLDTRLIIYDHNCDRPDYPLSILADPGAARYVHGTAFHLYAGRIDALSTVHAAHPDKHVYFTEQWIGAPGNFRGDLVWHVRELIIGASRHWSRTVLEWNLASDSKWEPHTDRGGCDRCLGAVTIDGNRVTRNPAYYIIAHASKFVRPGSVRIGSNTSDTLPNVAFRTPEGRRVLIVLNNTDAPRSFHVAHGGRMASCELPGRAVVTLVW